MKKIFYLLFAALCIVACNEKNTPSNPGDPSNPSDPSGQTDSKKVKYIVESAQWYTYENGSATSGVITKTVYERGDETKYLRSRSEYKGDQLNAKYTYQNESDRDYCWKIYPSGSENDKDTTIWYDEYRVKQKGIRSKNSRYIYEYDSQHNDRQVSVKMYYPSGQLWSESNYSYNGLTQNGETKFYDIQGNLTSRQTSVMEFRDDTFVGYNTWETESFDSEGKKTNSHISRYEWNGDLYTKIESNYVTYNTTGEVYSTAKNVITYNWQDELNNTVVSEYYQGESLFYRYEGYNKYKY